MKHGCKCGAHEATEAGYRQMTPDQRRAFDQAVRDCRACKRRTAVMAADRPRCRYCNDSGFMIMLQGGATGKPQRIRVPCTHPRSMALARAKAARGDEE